MSNFMLANDRMSELERYFNCLIQAESIGHHSHDEINEVLQEMRKELKIGETK